MQKSHGGAYNHPKRRKLLEDWHQDLSEAREAHSIFPLVVPGHLKKNFGFFFLMPKHSFKSCRV